jgi:ribonuclease P protein component
VTGRPSGGRSPKRRRLSRSAEFERVYRQGRSKSNRFLVLYAFPRADGDADPDGPRLGVSVSRRVGGAVDRTRVKRVLREAFWVEAERLPTGSDYVLVARPDCRELAERHGMGGVRTALAELVDALGPAARRSQAGGSAADDSSARGARDTAVRADEVPADGPGGEPGAGVPADDARGEATSAQPEGSGSRAETKQ